MGGLSETPAKDLMTRRPIKAVEEAIKGMLPKTKLGNQMYTKLKVYAGSAHRHAAQRPQTITLNSK
jgi:large subunit ribosomal protein L13